MEAARRVRSEVEREAERRGFLVCDVHPDAYSGARLSGTKAVSDEEPSHRA